MGEERLKVIIVDNDIFPSFNFLWFNVETLQGKGGCQWNFLSQYWGKSSCVASYSAAVSRYIIVENVCKRVELGMGLFFTLENIETTYFTVLYSFMDTIHFTYADSTITEVISGVCFSPNSMFDQMPLTFFFYIFFYPEPKYERNLQTTNFLLICWYHVYMRLI